MKSVRPAWDSTSNKTITEDVDCCQNAALEFFVVNPILSDLAILCRLGL